MAFHSNQRKKKKEEKYIKICLLLHSTYNLQFQTTLNSTKSNNSKCHCCKMPIEHLTFRNIEIYSMCPCQFGLHCAFRMFRGAFRQGNAFPFPYPIDIRSLCSMLKFSIDMKPNYWALINTIGTMWAAQNVPKLRNSHCWPVHSLAWIYKLILYYYYIPFGVCSMSLRFWIVCSRIFGKLPTLLFCISRNGIVETSQNCCELITVELLGIPRCYNYREIIVKVLRRKWIKKEKCTVKWRRRFRGENLHKYFIMKYTDCMQALGENIPKNLYLYG